MRSQQPGFSVRAHVLNRLLLIRDHLTMSLPITRSPTKHSSLSEDWKVDFSFRGHLTTRLLLIRLTNNQWSLHEFTYHPDFSERDNLIIKLLFKNCLNNRPSLSEVMEQAGFSIRGLLKTILLCQRKPNKQASLTENHGFKETCWRSLVVR